MKAQCPDCQSVVIASIPSRGNVRFPKPYCNYYVKQLVFPKPRNSLDLGVRIQRLERLSSVFTNAAQFPQLDVAGSSLVYQRKKLLSRFSARVVGCWRPPVSSRTRFTT